MKRKRIRYIAGLLALLIAAFTPVASVNGAELHTSSVKIDTSGYVFPNDWSRDALIFAVENGVLAGDENRDLRPGDYITRAEMAAVTVRLLGANEHASMAAFTDVSAGDWFYDEFSRAVAAGIFSGTSATTVAPNDYITREQTVTVLARAFGLTACESGLWRTFSDRHDIADFAKDGLCAMLELGAVTGYGDGTFRPQNRITRAEVASILYHLFDTIADTPADIPASGFVLYRGSEALQDALRLDGTLVLGQSVPAEFSAENWQISDALILRTGSGTNAVFENLSTDRLVCAPLGGTVCADTTQVWLWGKGCEFRGSAEALYCVDNEQSVSGSFGEAELRGGHLTLNGEADSVRLLENTCLTLNGSAGSAVLDGIGAKIDGSGSIGTLVQNRRGECSVDYETLDDSKYQAYYKEHDSALETVQTQRVPCQVVAKCRLFAERSLKNAVCEIPAGTTVCLEHHPSGGSCRVTYTDASGSTHEGWVASGNCLFPSVDTPTWDSSIDYSDATKEGFVNLRGYSSTTDYLIWVSRYTQRVVIFTGEKGNWKVKQTFLCSSGANSCPTPQGVYAIEAHYGTWHFSNYQVYSPTGFWGDFAFHSTPYRYDGSHYDNRLGMPLSKGCIRMNAEEAAYIYDAMPMGTTVVIW